MPKIINTSEGKVLTPIALVDKDGLVVMFHSAKAGTVIQSDGHFPVGFYSADWYMGKHEPVSPWTPFHGTITMNIL